MTPFAEIARVENRPDVSPGGPLSMFYVEVEAWSDVEAFGRRLRELVGAGVRADLAGDYEAKVISETDEPSWIADNWAGAAQRYAAHRGDEEWTIQDLLYSFEPGRRAWLWWDVTAASGNIVCMWIDSMGEAVYGCEEVRWMAYVAGARSVVGPLLREVGEWEHSTSLGL